jgi:hypothetical protein
MENNNNDLKCRDNKKIEIRWDEKSLQNKIIIINASKFRVDSLPVILQIVNVNRNTLLLNSYIILFPWIIDIRDTNLIVNKITQ